MTRNIKPVFNSRRLKVEIVITPKILENVTDDKMNICNICGNVAFHDMSEKEMKEHLNSHTDAEVIDKILKENSCLSDIKIISNSACSQEKILQDICDDDDDWDLEYDVDWDKIDDEISEKDACENPDYSSTGAWKENESNSVKFSGGDLDLL